MTVTDHDLFYRTIHAMNDEEIYSFFHSIYMFHVLAIIAIATGCLALREYFAYLGAEYRTWKLLFQGRVMLARLAIIVVRYAYIGAFISAVYFMLGKPKPKECQILLKLVFGLYTVLWSAAGSIFLMRLNILFSRQKPVMTLFYLLWAGCIGLWVFSTSKMTAYPIPKQFQFPFGPTCAINRIPKIVAIAWAGSILFDSVVFIATFIRFRNVNKSKEKSKIPLRSKTWIFRSSLYYFAASIIFNMAMLISTLFVNDPTMSNCGNALAFAIHCIVATRLVFNTKGWSQNGSMDEEEDDMVLNTFNKNRHNGGASNIHPTASRITYTVDETIVTSIDGVFDQQIQHQENDEISELHNHLHHPKRNSFNFRSNTHQQDATAEIEAKDVSSRCIRSRRPHRIRAVTTLPQSQNTLPKISRAGSVQAKGMNARQSIESLETKVSSRDDFAIRRRNEQVIPLPPDLYRPDFFSNNTRRVGKIAGGKSKALLDIAKTDVQVQQHTGNPSSTQARDTGVLNLNQSVFESRNTEALPVNNRLTVCSTPGTLSSPPSYSAMDQFAGPSKASTSSNNPSSLPSSYEIQQYQEYLLSLSKDDNNEAPSK